MRRAVREVDRELLEAVLAIHGNLGSVRRPGDGVGPRRRSRLVPWLVQKRDHEQLTPDIARLSHQHLQFGIRRVSDSQAILSKSQTSLYVHILHSKSHLTASRIVQCKDAPHPLKVR